MTFLLFYPFACLIVIVRAILSFRFFLLMGYITVPITDFKEKQMTKAQELAEYIVRTKYNGFHNIRILVYGLIYHIF